MVQTDHEQQLREQIFLVGIAIFLICYAVSLYRHESLMWATVIASLGLGITVGAGLLLMSFIRFDQQSPEQQMTGTNFSTPLVKGRTVDFSLAADDDGDAATAAPDAQQWEMGNAP